MDMDGPSTPNTAAVVGAGKGPTSVRPAERAYQGIRHAILTGALKPGELLVEEMLAAMTGTSRTPVRDALRRLVTEGLATVSSRHRYVTEFTFAEVEIAFDVRARLEGYTAGVAAERITPAELKRAAGIIADIDRIGSDHSEAALARFVELNTRFHQLILHSARSHQLKHMLAPAAALPLALLKQILLDQDVDIVRSNQQHRDILAALQARDKDAASAIMMEHILSTKPRRR